MKTILLSVLLYSTSGFAQSPSIRLIKTDFSNKDQPQKIRMYCGSRQLVPKPLFIVNGFVIADSNFPKINPSQIQSIDVLKDATATEQFGTKGKNGVIIITAKPALIDDLTKQGILKPIL